jgi:SAM-dependent methyltransferase
MSEDRRALWDERHAAAEGSGEVPAVLRLNQDLLPRAGRALDLACGRGAGALWLAERGLEVSARDYSAVAIARLQAAAAERGLAVDARVCDLLTEAPEPAGYDLILVSHFLERALCPAIAAALRPGGLLCYQTFGPLVAGAAGPTNPAFRLAANELLALFPTLTVRSYREPGALAATDDPLRGLALLVAQQAG